MPVALFSATYRSEKSWLSSAHSMTPAAAIAATQDHEHAAAPEAQQDASRSCSPREERA